MRTPPVRASCAMTGTNPALSKVVAVRKVSGLEIIWRSWVERLSYSDAALAQVGVGFADRVVAEVKYRRRQHRFCVAAGDTFVQVLQRADASRSNHRDRHAVRHRARQR